MPQTEPMSAEACRILNAIAISFFLIVSLVFTVFFFRIVESMNTPPTRQPSIYDRAVSGTIVPSYILHAIAIVESDEQDHAVGDGGRSIGRFQLNEKYHRERATRWSEYDPMIPGEAGRIAALYLQDCFIAYPGDNVRAICAYNQGIQGARTPRMGYYRAVTREAYKIIFAKLEKSGYNNASILGEGQWRYIEQVHTSLTASATGIILPGKRAQRP